MAAVIVIVVITAFFALFLYCSFEILSGKQQQYCVYCLFLFLLNVGATFFKRDNTPSLQIGSG